MKDSARILDIRKRFPLLDQNMGGYPYVYLDNAATTQKPQEVIDAISHYYRTFNANVHRGVHTLSQQATASLEAARGKVRDFIGAPAAEEVIFTRGTTESINLVAAGYARTLQPEDEIIVSQMEHHSNIVPWQMACGASGARLRVIPVKESGALDMEAYRGLLSAKTRVVSIAHISNVLGTVNPVAEIISLAHGAGAVVLLDAAQSVPHAKIDVRSLNCDYLAFSGHKMYAPTGIGVLWGRRELLEGLPPYQGGGEMIRHVTFERTTYASLPFKFEAGTPHIEGIIALGTAIDFLQGVGMDVVRAHETALMEYMTQCMGRIDGLHVYGAAEEKSGSFSFNLQGVHPTDVGMLLNNQGIAVRTGHHCAQPLMERYGIQGTVRASLGIYNTFDDIDRLYRATLKAKEMLL